MCVKQLVSSSFINLGLRGVRKPSSSTKRASIQWHAAHAVPDTYIKKQWSPTFYICAALVVHQLQQQLPLAGRGAAEACQLHQGGSKVLVCAGSLISCAGNLRCRIQGVTSGSKRNAEGLCLAASASCS
jgi:hypothetical protein